MFASIKPIFKKIILIFTVLFLLLLGINWLFPELGTTLQAKRLLRFWQEYEPSEKTWIAVDLYGQPLMNLSKEKNAEIWEALREVTFDKPQRLPLNMVYAEGLTTEDKDLTITIYDPETKYSTRIFLTDTEKVCKLHGNSGVPYAYIKNTAKLSRAAGEAYAKQFGEDYNAKYYAPDWQPNVGVRVFTREGKWTNIEDEATERSLIALLQGLRYEMTLDDFLVGVSDAEKADFDYRLEVWYPGEKTVSLTYGINAGEGSVYLSRAVDNSTGMNGKLRLEHGADLYPFLQSVLPREVN